MKLKKILKVLLGAVFLLFILINVVAFNHAGKFTHFVSSPDVVQGSIIQSKSKWNQLFFGIDKIRPENTSVPNTPFKTVYVEGTKKLECWDIKRDDALGTVLFFHGYGGAKSSMISRAEEVYEMGYNVFLVDQMGSGGSEGSRTTIGVEEAEQVKDCFEFIKNRGEQNVYLFGTSMGAASILKSIRDYEIKPDAIIIECPFGSFYKTTCARFRLMGVPEVPFAAMLMFWGGLQNGFWAFSHNPEEYAQSVQCPTLLLFGEKDNRVSIEETQTIFDNLKGEKVLKTFPLSGHENYQNLYPQEWKNEVAMFFQSLKS